MQKDVGQLYQTLGQHHMTMMAAKDPNLMRRVLFMVKSFQDNVVAALAQTEAQTIDIP